MIIKVYLLLIILALISLFICIQKENQEENQEEQEGEMIKEAFIDKLVLPPLVATRIRPFYRNNRKFYTELVETYSPIATKQMKKFGLV
jgi:hypothetical protein